MSYDPCGADERRDSRYIIQNDLALDEKRQNNSFPKGMEYDTMAVPQMSRRGLEGVPA